MCDMCPHDPIACRLSRFDVLLSVFFTHRWLLYFHVRSWRCRDVTLVETESAADEFSSQTAFFVLYELRFVFYFLLCGVQGVQNVVELRGIGVNVHLPGVALKAYVGGSHGHCWVELRYLLRHLLYTVNTCRWVKARSDWFESSWSKRHMLTRADLRDSDRHCRYVRRPLTMPT